MEGRDGIVEEHECCLWLAVRRVEPSRVTGEEALEELHPVLAHEGDALVPRSQRSSRVGPREGHACDPEGVRDPVRIAQLASRGDRLLREREGLFDATRRLETV